MDRDLTIMIYGAIMGVAGSIISSLISTIFQFWLARHEYGRKQNEKQSRQLRHIYLPMMKSLLSTPSTSLKLNPNLPVKQPKRDPWSFQASSAVCWSIKQMISCWALLFLRA